MIYCHTMDRDNLVAFGECGYNGHENEDWKAAIDLKLEVDNYAPMQSENTKNCILKFHPQSYDNYMKTYYDFDYITEILSVAHGIGVMGALVGGLVIGLM